MNYCSRTLPLLLSTLSLLVAAGTASAQQKSGFEPIPPPPTFQSGEGISPSSITPGPSTRPFQGTGSRFPGIPHELPWMNDMRAAREAQQLNSGQAFNPGSWNGFQQNRVPIGTVLTGILEADLSSAESKPGDIFSIRLEEGYFDGTREIVPKNSRIVGNVISVTPAQTRIHGIPGNLKVSLQMLVLPDGRNTRIFGHIDHNPGMDLRDDPRDNQTASQLSYYPRAAVSSLGMVGRTLTGRIIGIRPGVRAKGLDFALKQGEVLAVKINRSLDLTQLSPPVTTFIPPGMPIKGSGNSPPSQPITQPSSISPDPASLGKGFIPFPQQNQIQPNQSQPQPSSSGPPLAPPFARKPELPALHPGEDPNRIFDVPIGQKSRLEMPEPF